MKVILILLAMSLFLDASCTPMNADEPNPVISGKYSNQEIEQMIRSHKSSNSADVRPAESLNAKFKADFPKASDLDWEIGADIYQVDFEIGFTDYEAYYDKSGELLMYTVEYSKNTLPALVINGIIAKYPDYNFEDVEKIVSGTDTSYKIELEKGGTDIKVLIKADGAIIKEWFD